MLEAARFVNPVLAGLLVGSEFGTKMATQLFLDVAGLVFLYLGALREDERG